MKNESKVYLMVIPLVSFSLEPKYIYRLSDFAYGEWIIFEDDLPRYYLDIFDSIYKDLKEKLDKNKEATIQLLLEQYSKNTGLNLSLSQSFHWSPTWESKAELREFSLEKFPPDLLDVT